jgi:hypothetical protein
VTRVIGPMRASHRSRAQDKRVGFFFLLFHLKRGQKMSCVIYDDVHLFQTSSNAFCGGSWKKALYYHWGQSAKY